MPTLRLPLDVPARRGGDVGYAACAQRHSRSCDASQMGEPSPPRPIFRRQLAVVLRYPAHVRLFLGLQQAGEAGRGSGP